MTERRSIGPAQPLALEELVSNHCLEAGFTQEAAEFIAELSVFAICSSLAGTQVTFPKRALNVYRDRQIYQWHTGHNTEQLAQRHGITPRRLSQIVAQIRAQKGKV